MLPIPKQQNLSSRVHISALDIILSHPMQPFPGSNRSQYAVLHQKYRKQISICYKRTRIHIRVIQQNRKGAGKTAQQLLFQKTQGQSPAPTYSSTIPRNPSPLLANLWHTDAHAGKTHAHEIENKNKISFLKN